jgi:hypothetical protein
MILKTRRQTRKHIHRTVINDSFIWKVCESKATILLRNFVGNLLVNDLCSGFQSHFLQAILNLKIRVSSWLAFNNSAVLCKHAGFFSWNTDNRALINHGMQNQRAYFEEKSYEIQQFVNIQVKNWRICESNSWRMIKVLSSEPKGQCGSNQQHKKGSDSTKSLYSIWTILWFMRWNLQISSKKSSALLWLLLIRRILIAIDFITFPYFKSDSRVLIFCSAFNGDLTVITTSSRQGITNPDCTCKAKKCRALLMCAILKFHYSIKAKV